VCQFHPTILLNIGGKVLENILKNRINHVFFQGFMNKNQYGFTPQKGTIDVAMEIKETVKGGMAAEEVIPLVSLDVKGAFDAELWPWILKELSSWLPQNFYEPTKSYFTQRQAALSNNSLRLERGIRKGSDRDLAVAQVLGVYSIFFDEFNLYDMNKSGGLCG
jgi:hypothetical protein